MNRNKKAGVLADYFSRVGSPRQPLFFQRGPVLVAETSTCGLFYPAAHSAFCGALRQQVPLVLLNNLQELLETLGLLTTDFTNSITPLTCAVLSQCAFQLCCVMLSLPVLGYRIQNPANDNCNHDDN